MESQLSSANEEVGALRGMTEEKNKELQVSQQHHSHRHPCTPLSTQPTQLPPPHTHTDSSWLSPESDREGWYWRVGGAWQWWRNWGEKRSTACQDTGHAGYHHGTVSIEYRNLSKTHSLAMKLSCSSKKGRNVCLQWFCNASFAMRLLICNNSK